MEPFNFIFKLLAGVGLFLFAMHLIEESLKNLSGRNFKLFLQRISKNKISAVSGGAIVTGLLQSSTMISLMVLAFVGAGVFTMKNAMAIILGANIGTTLDSWLVVFLGFKLNMEVIAYPSVCIGGILLVAANHKKTLKNLAYFLFGLGLLFIALALMKTAMENEVKNFDFSKYTEMPLIVMLLIGFGITVLIQSSSVTMALALSTLHAGAISFPAAAAIVIGSETGTTIKLLLGAIGGTASKKRVTLGNLIFNILLSVLAFIFLKPILYLITDLFGIHDPLIGLVTFSSLINIIAVILFLPLLDWFAGLLEKMFKNSNANQAAFIGDAAIEEPETAMDLFQKETDYFIYNSMLFNLTVFDIHLSFFEEDSDFKLINQKKRLFTKTMEEQYEFIKQLQGELQAFYVDMRSRIHGDQSSHMNQLISAVRNAMHATKSIKDIGSNINNLRRSSKDVKFNFFMSHKKETEKLYSDLILLFSKKDKESYEKLKTIFENIHQNYSSSLKDFYREVEQASVEDIDLTIVINFNRELFTSNKAMLMAIKDLLLKEKQAENFNETLVNKP